MQRLADLIQPLHRIEGNTEVTAVAVMENNEVLQKLARAIETSSSLLKKQEEAVDALEEIVKESRAKDENEQDQHEDLEEKEHKEEMAKEELNRFRKLEAAFTKLADKMEALGGSGFDILAKIGKVIAALLTQYFFPHLVNIAMSVLPALASGLSWVFSNLMSLGRGIGEFLGMFIPGVEAGTMGAVGALAGLAAAIWLVMSPLRAIKGTLALLARAFEFASKRITASSTAGGGVGDLGGGGESNTQRGRQTRRVGRGGRVPTGGNRARPQQTSAPRPSVRPAPVARTAATGVPGRVVQGGATAAGGAMGRTALRALPIVGTAAAVGLGAYGAHTAVEDINAAVAAGEMTAAEASQAKGEAIGGATGGVAGVLGGAAAGAAIGSVVPVVGTAIGGVLGGIAGYYGGDWLGAKAGGAIGSSMAPAPVAAPAVTPAPAATPAIVLPAPTFWNPSPESEQSDEERFLSRMFKEQVDYFILQSKTTPLITQDINDFRTPSMMSGIVGTVGTAASRPTSPAPPAAGGTTSVPTTRSSGPMSADAFADIIGRAESRNDYSAFNDTYTDQTGRRRVRASYNTNLTNMTLGEVMAAQAEGNIFAAGRYQVIPETLKLAAAHLQLDPNDKFDSSMQDRIFKEYLITVKRPQIAAYLRGEGSLEAATLAAAREWASVGVPPGIKLNSGRISQGGESYYAGDGLNKAHITVGEVQGALTATRESIAAVNRGTGSALASTSGSLAVNPPGSRAPSNVSVTPVNAPTTIVQGGNRGTQANRSATPPPAVAYDVGAIA